MQRSKRDRRTASVYRITMEQKLRRHFDRRQPRLVLDVGSKDSPHRKHIPHTRYVRLDVDALQSIVGQIPGQLPEGNNDL